MEMPTNFLAVFCVMFAVFLHGGAAQTVHIVGDDLGWRIPSNPTAYSDWAAGKTFRVGDVLVFNFMTNVHDVVRVTKASFDACSDDDDIGEDIDVGPANYTLTAAGEYYFICSLDGHCQGGQKLAITVVSNTPPTANPPRAAPPTATPAFPPAAVPAAPAVHVVGDSLGWIVPANPSLYQTWASGKTFRAGDTLVFNFPTGRHDVVLVRNRASYDTCSDDDEIADFDNGPVNYTLNTVGEYFFICSIDGHCQGGQKLAITVVPPTSGVATPPMAVPPTSGVATPPMAAPPTARPPTSGRPLFPPTASPTSPPAPAVHVVGDSLGWIVPQDPSAYQNWATGKTFSVGDTLVFNFATGRHDVVRVPKASYDACSDDDEIMEYDNGPVNFTLTTPRDYYFICAFDGHCTGGQKLAITVGSSPSAPSTNPNVPVPPSPSSAPATAASSFLVVLLSVAVALWH